LLTRLVVCLNQVSVVVAEALVDKENDGVRHLILFDPSRCDVSTLRSKGVCCVSVNYRFYLLLALVVFRFTRNVEVCVPHYKFGRVMRLLCMLGGRTSLIDDGLDSLRNVPKNVEPERFPKGTAYYTFHYSIDLGEWLRRFSVKKIAHFSALSNASNESLGFKGVDTLIIESPPIERAISSLSFNPKKSLLITHTNGGKRKITNFPGMQLSGAEISIEKTLDSFSGLVIVGESMVAVFALTKENPKFNIVVCISRDNFDNLYPLVSMVKKCPFAELSVY